MFLNPNINHSFLLNFILNRKHEMFLNTAAGLLFFKAFP